MGAYFIKNGIVHIWGTGSSRHYYLGLGSSSEVTIPTKLPTKSDWKEVKFNTYYPYTNVTSAVFTDEEGKQFATGAPFHNHLFPLSGTKSVPTSVDSAATVNFVKRWQNNLVTHFEGKDGKYYGSGYNAQGQLVLGGSPNTSGTVAILASTLNGKGKWLDIQTVAFSLFALNQDGNVYSWGSSTSVSHASSSASRIEPILKKDTTTKFIKFSVDCSGGMLAAISDKGEVYVSGSGFPDTRETTANAKVLGKVGGIDGKVVDISANPSAIYALTDKGELYAWGSNAKGEAGVGYTGRVTKPTVIATDVVKVFRGVEVVTFEDSLGDIYVVGANDKGQCGLGHSSAILEPTLLYSELKSYVLIYNNGSTYKLSDNGDLIAISQGKVTDITTLTTQGTPLATFNSVFKIHKNRILSSLVGELDLITGFSANILGSRVKTRVKATPTPKVIKVTGNTSYKKLEGLTSEYTKDQDSVIKLLFEVGGKMYTFTRVNDNYVATQVSQAALIRVNGLDISELPLASKAISELIDSKVFNTYVLIDRAVGSTTEVGLTSIKGYSVLSTLTPKVRNISLNIVNTLPDIEMNFEPALLDGNITDIDTNSKVRYKVSLNGKKFFPPTIDNEWTEWLETPCGVFVQWTSQDVKIGETNTVKIDVQDKFGNTLTREGTFIGEYTGLLFTDKDEQFYTDDAGNILKYLEVGILQQGQTSGHYEILLVNNNPFTLRNVNVTSETNSGGTRVELSKENEPFLQEFDLNWDSEMFYKDKRKFYARLKVETEADVTNAGKFSITATGEL